MPSYLSQIADPFYFFQSRRSDNLTVLSNCLADFRITIQTCNKKMLVLEKMYLLEASK